MSPCITPEQVRLLVAEQLSAAEFKTLESHVEACPECQQTLARLLGDSHDVVRVDWRLLRRDSQAPSPESPSAFLRRLKENPPMPAPPDPPGVPVSPSPACSVELPVVPGYDIHKELGGGGMGIVYLARHVSLNRLVALKMMKETAKPREVARFRGEAEAIARLQHPHIVQIHEVGEYHGRTYLALEFIAGGSLDKKLNGTPLPAQQAAPLVETLARAIHYAHQQGIVHRDLKPANILLQAEDNSRQDAKMQSSQEEQEKQEQEPQGRNGPSDPPSALPLGVLASWREMPFVPKITDFGLARQVGDAAGATPSGVIEGTPSYIAPEQACSTRQDIGPAADVYALGAILYEVLTGRAPFKAATPLETLLQVRADDPVPPRVLQPKTPRDLETICLKCLQKEPRQRYASAQDLAEDLRRFQVGEPIQARPVGALERAVKWVQRKPAAAALWGVSVAAVALLLWLGLARAERQAQTTRAVEQALAEATLLRTQARSGPTWDLQAWGQALAAAKRAEALLEGGAGPERLRQQVRELLAELQAEDQDRRMMERVQDIRLRIADVREGEFDFARADKDYATAFQQYGIEVETLSPAEVADRIRGRPLQEALVAAVDDWAIVRRAPEKENAARWQRLIEIARRADPDPWRNRFRDILMQDDKVQALKDLVAEGKTPALPPSTWNLLGSALAGVGALPEAVQALRQGQQQHPGDFWINFQLALYLTQMKPPQVDEALRYYTAAVALRSHCAAAHLNLGNTFRRKGAWDQALAAYRQAIRLSKDFPQAHYSLGYVLQKKGQLDDAIASFKEVLRLRPDFPEAHYALGYALFKKGLLDEAIAAYKEGIRLKQNYPVGHYNLGVALQKKGQLDTAIASYQRALRLQKDYPEVHHNLGLALAERGQLDEAIASFKKALRLQKDHALTHCALGLALARIGQLDAAVASCKEALRLKPNLPEAHVNLGNALLKKGELEQAIISFREALRLQKDYPAAHMSLGVALAKSGQLDAAISSFKETLCLKKDYPEAHMSLGFALAEKGQLDDAIASFKEALRLQKDYALAHYSLGRALQIQGKFALALVALRRGHELGSKDPCWPYPSAKWVRRCERLVELDAMLPAILRGEAKPADTHERLEFADLCGRKRQYGAATGFYQEAFAVQPQLAEDLKTGHRYNAACAAALASCGQGEDAAKLDARARGRLRQLALGWLRADLKLWATDLVNDKFGVRHLVGQVLRHWKRTPALAGVRDEKALVQLPEAERAAWQQLWAEVEILQKKAQESTK
jgi:serine/threonine-protein kinase